MSRVYKEDDYVKCPFYRSETPIEIKCDGIIGCHTVSVFRTKNRKEEYKYDFCCGNYRACPIEQENEKNEEAV